MNHVMYHDCFEKYIDSEKKRYFFQNQKHWLPSEGRSDSKSILYYTLKKTDIKFGRGDCEWRVGSILSTQYWLLSPRYGY